MNAKPAVEIPTSPDLKAYAVEDSYGDNGAVIVFSARAVSARRQGANELDCAFGEVGCHRAPWADGFAPGPVPPKAAIEAGNWRYECGGCGEWVDIHTEAPFYEDDGQPWCSQACHDSTKAHWAKQRAEREAAEANCREATLSKFPFAQIAYMAVSTSPDYTWRVYFKFLGGKNQVIWSPSAPNHVRVTPVDIEAWRALVPEPPPNPE